MTSSETFSTIKLNISSVLQCNDYNSSSLICKTNFTKVSSSTPGAECNSNGKCYTSVKYPYSD